MSDPIDPAALPQPNRVKSRTLTEWHVTSEREGGQISVKRYRSMKAVVARIGRLVSNEPWRFYGDHEISKKAPDDYVCCRGNEYDACGCGGATMREQTAEIRKNLPKIVSIRVSSRQITYTGWQVEDAEILVHQLESGYVHA